ncbi:hypothetical protein [Kineococcus terrestris]|uniref:hypothetical protein n=1 Tax=Kineococcus terrestris TaxID=2044856 RepID=UPI0034DABC9D
MLDVQRERTARVDTDAHEHRSALVVARPRRDLWASWLWKRHMDEVLVLQEVRR